MKKGQVTMYILIGVVILIVGAMVIYTNYQQQTPDFTAPAVQGQRLGVQGFMTSCLQDASRKGFYLAGYHGGYLNVRGDPEYGEPGINQHVETMLFIEHAEVPTLYNGQQARIRSLDLISEAIMNYILVETHKCADFSQFAKQGIQVTKPNVDFKQIDFDLNRAIIEYSNKPLDIKINYGPKKTTVTLSYPLIINDNNNIIEVNEFVVDLPTRFNLLHERALRFLNNINQRDEYNLQQNCAQYQSPDGLINVYAKALTKSKAATIKFVDAYPKVAADDMPLSFQFAVKNIEVQGQCTG